MKRLIAVSLVLLSALLLSGCTAGANAQSWPGLAADENNAYLANGQFLYAVRLSDGVKICQYPPDKAGKELFYSNPVLTPDGQLLVGSSGLDFSLISLDPATCTGKWAVPFTADNHWVASPLVVDDIVYAPNNNGTLYAIKLATGELAWSLPISHSLWGTPASDGKLIYLGSLDHFLYAVDIQSHKVVWKQDLGGSITGAPLLAADGSDLYVGSFAKKVFAVQASDGAIRWTAPLKDWVWSTPALSGDTIFAADISSNIYSLGAPNGKNAWPEVKPDLSITASPVAIPDGVVVATESGSLYAFKPDGSRLWSTENIGGKIYTTPVIAGDRIIVAPLGAENLLYAVNAKDGSLLPWHFSNK